ncbi:O-antigen ligase family protein [Caloramator sp. E03]|uniref:O-antigen ligase family protein n=1 Tax=Caloramator sp. E03 TaxID=2576307 RepID=UPI001110AE2C|nr:O-antigen ligase family protein [Caloramator sp. E03]QCX32826.1 O-antigen ligase family protein [Caloramator sp. E03]
MFLKRLFNVIMYSFIIIVPIMPLKVKIKYFPMSADFILGSFAIALGVIYSLYIYNKDGKEVFDIFFDKRIKILNVLIILFVLLSLISVSYSVNKTVAITETFRFLEYVILFYLILIISDDRFIKIALLLFFLSMILANIYGVVQFALNLSNFRDAEQIYPLGRGRVFATFENPNYWGCAVNTVIFIPIIDMLESKKIKIIYNLLLFILFAFNLLMSFTRGSWVGFALGLILLFLLRYRKGLIALPFIGVLSLLVPLTRKRILSIFSFSSLTNNERLKLWKTGIIMFKEHFWTGVGNGNYLYRYTEYVKKYKELYLGRWKFSVHNSYIKMFAELGIFGGLIFIGIYLNLFYLVFDTYLKSEKYKLYALAALCFIVSYVFQNFFNNLMFIPQLNVFVWIIIALLYKGKYLEEQEDKNE